VLNIVIGVGNTLVENILEWVEERIEQIYREERESRNSIIYAQVQAHECKKSMMSG
jgi:hypothetical protein